MKGFAIGAQTKSRFQKQKEEVKWKEIHKLNSIFYAAWRTGGKKDRLRIGFYLLSPIFHFRDNDI